MDNLDQYHLYLSKSSDIRSQIKSQLVPLFEENILTTSFDRENIERVYEQIITHPLYDERERQVIYGFVDLLLFTYLNTQYFKDVLDFLMVTVRSYIAIHELAALAWGDELIPPTVIFHRLEQTNLSPKHVYHILNEMSVTFPKETMKFVQKKISEGELKPDMKMKLINKMIQDRTRDQPLSKDVIPRIGADQIEQLYLDQ